MNLCTLCTLVLMLLFASPAMAQDQPRGLERTPPTGSSESSDVRRPSRSSWEAWLDHGAREGPSTSSVPPRSPDLGMPTAPLSPSIGPGSGLLGPEGGRSPARLRSDREAERGEARPGGGLR